MSESEVKAAIKALYNKHEYSYFRDFILNDCKSDLLAAEYGPTTLQVASYFDMPLEKVRRKLNSLEKKGITVKKCTKGGSCRWWYNGLLEEIRGDSK